MNKDRQSHWEMLSPRTLTVASLAVSFVISIAILATRNLYDDEISTLPVVTSSAAAILQHIAIADIHPPGMYLLAHLAWLMVPSYRWMNLVPCAVLYAGLAVFLAAVVPLFQTTRARVLLLLLATLHPELLLWSNTFRWYSWWTGLALIALTAALQLGRSQTDTEKPVLRWPRAVALGLMLAALFYINYITLLFAAALAIAMWFRYRMQPRRELLACAGVTTAVSSLLIAPLLHTMLTVHLPRTAEQRSHIPASAMRLIDGLAASESYLPWHPLAVLACLCFALLAIAAVVQFARGTGPQDAGELVHDPRLSVILLFAVSFFVLVMLSGLGGKPRNGLLLVPVLAPLTAAVAGGLQRWIQNVFLLVLALWSGVGIAHMLGRYGLAKATMNDRPEEVVRFVREDAAQSCAIIATYDTGLAFVVRQAALPHAIVLSPRPGAVSGSSQQQPQIITCASARLYMVRSYLGGDDEWRRTLNAEFAAATRLIQGTPQISSFSRDREAARKRSLARMPLLAGDLADAAELPDYRFVVTSGAIDPRQFATLEQQLPNFTALH